MDRCGFIPDKERPWHVLVVERDCAARPAA